MSPRTHDLVKLVRNSLFVSQDSEETYFFISVPLSITTINPLRARLVSDMKGLNMYKYSGHTVLMGKGNCDWQETKYEPARGRICS
jgi:hypothetical protein